jgi:hypothetical protein
MRKIDNIFSWICVAGCKVDATGKPMENSPVKTNFGGSGEVSAGRWSILPIKCIHTDLKPVNGDLQVPHLLTHPVPFAAARAGPTVSPQCRKGIPH